MLVTLFRGEEVDEAHRPGRRFVGAIEVEHDLGIDPGQSWSLCGRFLGCAAKLAQRLGKHPMRLSCPHEATQCPLMGPATG
jgi:hypothetical protein